MNRDIKLAISAAVAGAVTLAAASAYAADKPAATEKCYGVAAAGHNDCQTASNSCAGTSEKDRQPDAFVTLPKGLCSKIAGGSLTVAAPAKKKS